MICIFSSPSMRIRSSWNCSSASISIWMAESWTSPSRSCASSRGIAALKFIVICIFPDLSCFWLESTSFSSSSADGSFACSLPCPQPIRSNSGISKVRHSLLIFPFKSFPLYNLEYPYPFTMASSLWPFLHIGHSLALCVW